MTEEYLYFCVKCNCDFWIGPHVNIFYDNKYLPIPISLNVGNYIISNYGDDLGFPNAGSSFHYCINLTCSKFIILSCVIIFLSIFVATFKKLSWFLLSLFVAIFHRPSYSSKGFGIWISFWYSSFHVVVCFWIIV